MNLCKCGCGEETGYNFVVGHNWRFRRQQMEPPNPSGICQCGCGAKTRVASMTETRGGYVAGEHVRFLQGHGCRKKNRWVEEDRGFDTPCWIWQLSLDRDGYGLCGVPNKTGRIVRAHSFHYEERYGPVPEGLIIDHLCRVRCCVNPDHMEPVTNAENIRRGYAARRASLAKPRRDKRRTPSPPLAQASLFD